MESLKHVIEDSIRTLQLLQEAYSSNEGWIVESENYINVCLLYTSPSPRD